MANNDYDYICPTDEMFEDRYDSDMRKPRVTRHCVCGTDMPGTCPGVDVCPYSGDDDD